MKAYFAVKAAGKQRPELYAEKPPFREKGTVLLDDGEEMRKFFRVRYDDGFSEQGAAFGTSDIKGVAKTRKVGKGNIV